MNEKNISTIGARLREEREHITPSQDAFGGICHVSRRTVSAWENGEQFPNAEALERMSAAGADVLYIVTGRRVVDNGSLSAEESALLASFASADEAGRAALLAVASLASRPAGKSGKGNTVAIGGDVGQSIAGDASFAAPMSFVFGKKKPKSS